MSNYLDSIGGIQFAKGEVASSKIVKKERTNSAGLWEQYDMFHVTLKDGTKIKYETQADDRKATIDIRDDGSVDFFGLKDVSIQGTPKNDKYRLHGCESSQVYVRGDSENNFVTRHITEYKMDTVTAFNRELPDGSIQKSKDNYGYADKDDKFSGSGFERYGVDKK